MNIDLTDIKTLHRANNSRDIYLGKVIRALQNNSVPEQDVAFKAAQFVLAKLDNVSHESLNKLLQVEVADDAAYELLAEQARNSGKESLSIVEKRQAKADRETAKAVKDQARANRQKEKEEALKKSLNGRQQLVVEGDNVVDISTVLNVVDKALGNNPDVYLCSDLLTRWSDRLGKAVMFDSDNIGPVLSSSIVFAKSRMSEQGLQIEHLCQVPTRIANSIISTQYVPSVRELDAVLNYPVVTTEGEVVGKAAGYDSEHKFLFTHNLNIKSVDIYEAGKAVYDVFHEFPADSVPGALGLLFTLLTRQLLPAAPMFCVDAPAEGSGKSLLAECCLEMVNGQCIKRALTTSREENTKTIHNHLQNYPGQALFIDEVAKEIDEPVLKSITSGASEYVFRILGTAKDARVKTNFPIIIAGNNLMLQREIKRRSIVVTIDTKMQNPNQRETSRSPDELKQYIRDNREYLLSCAISLLVDAINNATDKHSPRKMGGFDTWVKTVGRSVRYVCDNLVNQGLIAPVVNTDLTPDMKSYDASFDGTGECWEMIYREQSGKKWQLSDLGISLKKYLDPLLGTDTANTDSNKLRGERLHKKKDRPFEHEGSLYRLTKDGRYWRIDQITNNGVIIDPTLTGSDEPF